MLNKFKVFLILVQIFFNGNIDVHGQQHPDRISQKKCDEIYFPENSSLRTTRNVHERITRNAASVDNNLGKIPTTSGEFPYMAALGYTSPDGGDYEFKCGGVLISRNFVLTAAHCVNSPHSGAPEVVRIGDANLEDTSSKVSTMPIKKITVHPDYTNRYVYNDIAILELESSSDHLPACLWQTNEIEQLEGTAIGYGTTSIGGQGSKDLMKVVLDIFTNQKCQTYYTETNRRLSKGIIDSQICVGSHDSNIVKDTCQGDAGGPMILSVNKNNKKIPYVGGIISFGISCGVHIPSVLTRVSSYLDWIESIVYS